MIRRLRFSNSEILTMVYQGFVTGGSFTQPQHGTPPMVIRRLEAGILQKFEDVAIIEERSPGEYLLHPKNGAQPEIGLHQPEFDLLVRYFENTPWKTAVARRVVEISDWLANVTAEDK